MATRLGLLWHCSVITWRVRSCERCDARCDTGHAGHVCKKKKTGGRPGSQGHLQAPTARHGSGGESSGMVSQMCSDAAPQGSAAQWGWIIQIAAAGRSSPIWRIRRKSAEYAVPPFGSHRCCIGATARRDIPPGDSIASATLELRYRYLGSHADLLLAKSVRRARSRHSPVRDPYAISEDIR